MKHCGIITKIFKNQKTKLNTSWNIGLVEYS